MKDTKKKRKSLGTILTVGLIGAALGVLFIPYRRNELRNKVITGTQNLTDFLTEKFKTTADEIVRKTEKILESQKPKAENLAEGTKEKLEQAKSRQSNQEYKL